MNIIKGIVASQEKLEKDKTDDTREAREKSKREKFREYVERQVDLKKLQM